MQKQTLAFLFALFTGYFSFGQRINWTAFRLTEENEFFNITHRGIDQYYTQGMRFEFTYQTAERKLLEKLVIPIPNSSINYYSLSLSQQIYSPHETESYFFAGDMPYSGALYFSESLESLSASKQFRLTTRLHAGMIGPAALVKNTQLLFHKIIKNDLAVGWDTQLRNDIYLNYSLKAERALTKPNSLLRVEGKAEANIGTVLISAVPGFNFELGTWYNPSKKFSWQVFFRPEVRWVLYNALLQGGIINQATADEFYAQYFIKKIKPLVYSHSSGFQIRYNRLELFYRQVNLTREFTGQRPHYFSTIMFTFPIQSKLSNLKF